jgi:hypothetical protein
MREIRPSGLMRGGSLLAASAPVGSCLLDPIPPYPRSCYNSPRRHLGAETPPSRPLRIVFVPKAGPFPPLRLGAAATPPQIYGPSHGSFAIPSSAPVRPWGHCAPHPSPAKSNNSSQFKATQAMTFSSSFSHLHRVQCPTSAFYSSSGLSDWTLFPPGADSVSVPIRALRGQKLRPPTISRPFATPSLQLPSSVISVVRPLASDT